jgi:CheY-like chemotaxis protein
MPGIPTLVVDDDAQIRDLLRIFLTEAGCDVETAPDGERAMAQFRDTHFPLVVTDLRMPGASGLRVMEAVRESSPETAVIVISGHATRDDTVEALRLGAFDFIEKPFGRAQVHEAISRFRRMKIDLGVRSGSGPVVLESSSVLRLPSDPSTARAAATWLTRDLASFGLASPAEREAALLAVHEAILNAIIHGNLGVSSEIKQESTAEFAEIVEARRADPVRGARSVRVEYRANAERAEWSVEDEGDGFDPSGLPDPTYPDALLRLSGRGLMIIRLTMSEVEWNARGNRIRMAWRRRGAAHAPS